MVKHPLPRARVDWGLTLHRGASTSGCQTLGVESHTRIVSSHYTFSLSIRLRAGLTLEEVSALEYMVNGDGEVPTQLPSHFNLQRLRDLDFRKQYRDFPTGSYHSNFLERREEGGEIIECGVSLLLPGQKLEGVYGEPFELARWLATISTSIGHVGSITCEDDDKGIPTLLFVRDNQLCIASPPDDMAISAVPK